MRGFGGLSRKLVLLVWGMWILGVYVQVPVCAASGQGMAALGEYTDENGVIYAYSKSNMDHISIIGISNYEGKIVDIPAEIDGYPVIELNFMMNSAAVAELHIPEKVTSMKESVFADTDIGILYYKARQMETEGAGNAFKNARIGELVIGADVQVIPVKAFQEAQFLQEKVVLNVKTVGKMAFYGAEMNELAVTDQVEFIGDNAFALGHIKRLEWDANVETELPGAYNYRGIFYSANVSEISWGNNTKSIPEYMFYKACIGMEELEIDVETIGGYAFCENQGIKRLTLGEHVRNIGFHSFAYSGITEVEFNSVDAYIPQWDNPLAINFPEYPFHENTLTNISIGDQVTIIPNYLFGGVIFQVEELEFPDSLTEIGIQSFSNMDTTMKGISSLVIGENVKKIGSSAFWRWDIGTLFYNAREAEVAGDYPFYVSCIRDFRIGEEVAVLPSRLLSKVQIDLDMLVIPDNVVKIEDDLMYGETKSDKRIGTVEIGGKVSYIGKRAFGDIVIDRMVVHAVTGYP